MPVIPFGCPPFDPLFLMQGYGKVFTYTVPKLYSMFFKDFEKTFLPKFQTKSMEIFSHFILTTKVITQSRIHGFLDAKFLV